MPRSFTVLIIVFFCSTHLMAEDWPQWRGPAGNNHAPPGTTAPVVWGEGDNLAWIAKVPGRGHSSPTVVGDSIYLTTADERRQTQSLLIYDRKTGNQLHEILVHQGGVNAELHPNNTHASSTVASDGERVFAMFHNDGAVWLTAFDLTGKQLWQQRAIGFQPQLYKFGFGSSPIVLDGQVIVASEYDGGESGVVALDASTGKRRWKIARPQSLSYSTPAIAVLQSKKTLLLSGNRQVAAYSPRNGSELWSTEAEWRATCGTMIWDEGLGLSFASGGYPTSRTVAVRTDGNHEVVWSNRLKCYEQSMLLVDHHIYLVTDAGVAYCLRASDGEEMWKKRLGGKYSSSPLLVNGKIYVTSEAGTTHVFVASPDKFQSLGENQLGTDCFATPAPVGNRLYHRYGAGSGDERQEFLVAIGE